MNPLRPKPYGPTRWPVGLLGMLAIVVGIETFFAHHRLDVTDSAALSWSLSDRAAVGEAREAQVLIFGDSLAKHGLLPEVIGPRIGRTSFNLSAAGAQAATSYYMIKHALDAGSRPEAVVVDFMPDLLAGDVGHTDRQWPELLSIAETVELARASRDVTFFVRATIAHTLRSYRSRREIRTGLWAALRGESDPLRIINQTLARNWAIHGGAQFTRDNPVFDDQVTQDEHGRPLPDRFRCSRVNRYYVNAFFRLARSREIAVYWVLPPVSPGLQSRRERGGGDANYSEFVRSRVATDPGVVVLDARRSGYDRTRFVDPIHLTGKGAIALSETVADAISTRQTGWIVLGPCRDAPVPGRFEDLEESRIAVLSGLSERR